MEKGFSLKEGVYYEHTFSLMTLSATIRTPFTLEAQNGSIFHEMDVKIAFLNRYLKYNVFMFEVEGFFMKGQEYEV